MSTPLAIAAVTRALMNLLLYQAAPNPAWRNTDLPVQGRPGENGSPPLALNLYYLLTAFVGDAADETDTQTLLGQAMGALHDHPLLGVGPGDVLTISGQNLDGGQTRVRFTSSQAADPTLFPWQGDVPPPLLVEPTAGTKKGQVTVAAPDDPNAWPAGLHKLAVVAVLAKGGTSASNDAALALGPRIALAPAGCGAPVRDPDGTLVLTAAGGVAEPVVTFRPNLRFYQADERIVNYVMGLNQLDDRLGLLATPLDPRAGWELIPGSQAEVAEEVLRQWGRASAVEAVPVAELLGPDPASKELIAWKAAEAYQARLYPLTADLLSTTVADLGSLTIMGGDPKGNSTLKLDLRSLFQPMASRVNPGAARS